MLNESSLILKEVKLSGINGWPNIMDSLIKNWLPHIKLQAPKVISGVTGLNSIVNVGEGLADLILLPIEQYKKDGKIIKGLKKGMENFASKTALETIKISSKLSAGTQVILEQADGILSNSSEPSSSSSSNRAGTIESKFSDQPKNIGEGFGLGFSSLKKNISTAANTVLAIPTEVYEKNSQVCFHLFYFFYFNLIFIFIFFLGNC